LPTHLLVRVELQVVAADSDEQKQLETHRWIASLLVDRPELVERARILLQLRSASAERVRLWRALLDRPTDEIEKAITAETSHGAALRRTSPLEDVAVLLGLHTRHR
jgi:hypothetical protein